MSQSSVPVSVIVPSYNSTPFLAECIAAINSGTRPHEILIVDDASTDGSLVLARRLSEEFSNVVVIARVANGGAAASRRDGIRASRNEWIAFVDADDYIEPDAVRIAYEGATRAVADICIWQLWRASAGREWRFIDLDEIAFPVSGRQAAIMTIGEWKIHPLGVSRKSVYEAAYMDFDESAANADELVTRLAFQHARVVAVCGKR